MAKVVLLSLLTFLALVPAAAALNYPPLLENSRLNTPSLGLLYPAHPLSLSHRVLPTVAFRNETSCVVASPSFVHHGYRASSPIVTTAAKPSNDPMPPSLVLFWIEHVLRAASRLGGHLAMILTLNLAVLYLITIAITMTKLADSGRKVGSLFASGASKKPGFIKVMTIQLRNKVAMLINRKPNSEHSDIMCRST